MDENACSKGIIGAAIEVHRCLGPGLLEATYEEALIHELTSTGLSLERQLLVPISYKGFELANSLRLDLIVNELVIVEIKAVDVILPIHDAQLLTYLRLTNKKLGLLLNFNSPSMRTGIKRVVNRL